MKNPKMTLVAVVMIALTASAVYGWSYHPELFTVASKGGGAMTTKMAGDYLVWQDMMDMRWYGYDLPSMHSFTIPAAGAMTMLSNESYALWQDNMTMEWRAYDLAQRQTLPLTVSDVDGMSIRLTGRFMVFKRMTDMTLHAVDLQSDTMFDITSTDVDSMSVRVAGDYVIWRTMSIPAALAGFELSTQQGFVLSADEVDSMSIAMSDRFVAWREMPMAEPAQAGLYAFDLASRQKFLITSEDTDSMSLKAAGRYIIWRSMATNVLYRFDAVSREPFEIGANIDSMSLLVNEAYVVWKDTMNMHLYGFDLADRRLIETGQESMYAGALAGSCLFWYFNDPDLMINELRGFDLATGTPFTVATISSAGTMSPMAHGDYVVWNDMVPPSADNMLLGAHIWKIPNDECEDAVEVFADTPYNGDTTAATGTDRTDCAAADDRDTWHEFRPPIGADYTIDVRSDIFDTTLAVFPACSVAATACNDDANNQTIDSRLTLPLVKGKRYLIRVAGVDGSGGPYELAISQGSCAAPPRADMTDDCKVNLADLAVFSSQWLDCGLNPPDLCM